MQTEDPNHDPSADLGDPTADAHYASLRRPDRTYVSKTFPFPFENSSDHGQPTRFVYKVFDPQTQLEVELVGEEWVISETPAGRFQVRLRLVREDGNVTQLWIQRISADGKRLETKFSLKGPELKAFLDLVRNVASVPIQGEESVRVDDSLIKDLFADPAALATLHKKAPELLVELIGDDSVAREAVTARARRSAVSEFERLVSDDDYFDQRATAVGGDERVWQDLFEANPWLLGATMSSQLLTSWSPEKLEQTVRGWDLHSSDKRADALMRTAGLIRSLVFLEIKTHRSRLLGREYRSDCWPPSVELSGAVAQSAVTVHKAVEQLTVRLQTRDEDGADVSGDFSYLVKPRCLVIVGSLAELQSDTGGDHVEKIRSFELYRRGLVEPEVVTFDELLARAQWVVGS